MALIERKTAKFDPGKFHDRYVEALEDLIERKRKGKTIHTEEDESEAGARHERRRPDGGAQALDRQAGREGAGAQARRQESTGEESTREGGAGTEDSGEARAGAQAGVRKILPDKGGVSVMARKDPNSLETYNEKRDFAKTAEPRGESGSCPGATATAS
jgi:hypothetical protein